MKNVIDISYAQGEVDFKALIKNNPKITGVMIKATEGIGVVDKMLKRNAEAVAALVLPPGYFPDEPERTTMPFGYYHFAIMHSIDPTTHQKTTPQVDAKKEVDWFLSQIKDLPRATLAIALDLETNKVGNLGIFEVEQWATNFMEDLKAANYKQEELKLYGGVPFLNSSLPLKHKLGVYGLWLARYTNELKPVLPNGWTDFWLWQFTSMGRVAGIKTNVDLSRK